MVHAGGCEGDEVTCTYEQVGSAETVIPHLVSCVVPCFNEEAALSRFFEHFCSMSDAMRARWPELTFELLLVDDGSSDGTLDVVHSLAMRGHEGVAVRWVALSRNFGKEPAMLAGLERARGAFACVMDADLQDPPELLERMYELVSSGACDVAAARRIDRTGDSLLHGVLAHAFYRLSSWLLSVKIPDGARDFRLMRRAVLDAVLSLPERDRFSKGLFAWVGFKTTWISYHDPGRSDGKSGWSSRALLRYALSGIFSFSEKPLFVVSGVGVVLTVAALSASCFIVVRALAFGDPVPGWPSIACLVTFLGGLQLLCLSIIGGYVARNFAMLKGRPAYIVRSESDDAPLDRPLP